MTLDTRDDSRTLFFDLLPIFFTASAVGPSGASTAAGFSFRIKVYTVPGQPVHKATRKVVLAGADGVDFVADSAKASASRTVRRGPGSPRTSPRSGSSGSQSSSSTTSAISRASAP